MKALIFAAGLGTRLKPITDSIPKALVPISGKPLLQLVIEKLKSAGFNEIIINVHHFPDQIIDFLKANNSFDIRIEVSDERDELLDTGGGIRKTAWFFDDGKPFLVHNVDILSNVDLNELYQQHLHSNSLATLVVSKRDTFRYLLFDDNLRLNGWINEKTGETKPVGFRKLKSHLKLAFAGIQVLSPEIFDTMKGLNPKFPVMDFYLFNAKTSVIKGFVPDNFNMMDVGKLDVLDEAEKFVRELSFE
jgi:NDP-sugar pyrophosphorylase family protein